jgi:hypothetical protein
MGRNKNEEASDAHINLVGKTVGKRFLGMSKGDDWF